jgi:predicted DNA-binding transcriptional regulator AlpA
LFLGSIETSKMASPHFAWRMKMHQLPETGYLRLSQIIGKPAKADDPGIPAIIPVSRSTWWAGVKAGRYPQPSRTLGSRITAWRVEDIRALIARGGPIEESRAAET